MAGFITCTSFRTPTGYITGGAGAANSSFPHAYAADIARAHRPWKSAANLSIGSTFYGVDFGSAVALEGVGIDNVNQILVALQAASDTAFSSNLITLGVGVTENQVERGLFATATAGRPKAFVDLLGTDFEGESRRYWRILCASAEVDGVTSPMVIGSVAWCASLDRWASGTSRYEEQPLEATRLNDDFAGGGADPVIVGNGHAAISLAAAPGDYATMRTPLLKVLRQGLGRPFLFYRNAGDTSDFYICHRAADVSVATTAPTLIEFSQFIMRSAV